MSALRARLRRIAARAPNPRVVSPESRERLRRIFRDPSAARLALEVSRLHSRGTPDSEKIALLNRRLREIGVGP